MARMKVEGAASPRWALWKWFRLTRVDGTPYLTRLRVIETPWFALWIHWIFSPDVDAHPHDHPRGFVAFVLSGGYDEAVWSPDHLYSSRPQEIVRHSRFSVNVKPSRALHRIDAVRPNTKTLLFLGRRKRVWGFQTERGWVPFLEYEA